MVTIDCVDDLTKPKTPCFGHVPISVVLYRVVTTKIAAISKFLVQIHDVMLSVLSTVSGTDNNVKLANINNAETKFRLMDHFFNTSLYYDNSDAVLNGLQFQNSQGPNSKEC